MGNNYDQGRLNLPFVGICTFGKYPYVSDWDQISADVAVMGAPFDFGSQFRTGSRMGPRGVREASTLFSFGHAGAYDHEIAHVLITAEAIDRDGNIHTVGVDELGFSYRNSKAPTDWIFTSATLYAEPGDKDSIIRKMDEITAARETSQPIRSRTGGSTFKNTAEGKAWELIDDAGCRGLRVGDAQVSQHHCNFLINLGHASANDIERLGTEVRRRVHEKSGIMLQWEINRIGLTEKEAAS